MQTETRKARPPMGNRTRYDAPHPAQDKHTTIEAALADALASRGITGLAIRTDGDVHRFDAPDKRRGNLAGWYVCPTLEVAVFGFWHTGEQQTVTVAGEHDPIAAEQARQAAAKARRGREVRRQQEQAQAAQQARQTWAAAAPADHLHPYLTAKGVQPHNLRQRDGTLLVPLYAEKELVSLQRIHADGTKRFLTRGRIKGAASLVGRLAGAGHVYVTEGWATAAKIHEASGCPVVATMAANNLEPVARTLRRNLAAHIAITIAADNDRRTPGNPGLTYGRHAAEIIGADITWPRFPCEDCACSDFNDLAACEGRKETAA
ncbi:MAG: toprim domain-containing protein [Halomonas sp.]|uniref:toprim domain-containing protein n=1 Tax=Halomonas sp. TaxID=1486246 RepID=UPI002ACE34D2|nr:toprim domain-containing protein [Halomonas sp.]MDZ7852329.1 toprim domain-containing protein [Halomonas sp.]